MKTFLSCSKVFFSQRVRQVDMKIIFLNKFLYSTIIYFNKTENNLIKKSSQPLIKNSFSYLFDQSIAENAEQENLSESIEQISDNTQSEYREAVNLCRLVRQESQHDGRCQHVE
jgi:prephenate dehydratase